MSRETGLVFGLHAVEALLASRPGDVQALSLQSGRRGPRIDRLLERARRAGVQVQRVHPAELDALVGQVRHQGVVASFTGESPSTEDDLEALCAPGESPPLLLVLDGVQDPHNLGACLRTADAAGAAAVIVPRDRAVGMTAIVRKVASGAAESIPLVPVTNLARALRRLKTLGIWLIGTAPDVPDSLFDADLKGPTALVLGAEGHGLRRLTREHCDHLVRLPMAGSVESLNVSVAAGICLFEAVRQRSLV